MGSLTEEKGRELLKKKIFSESERSQLTEEEDWMDEYLENIHNDCGGLPLALSVVGDLLAGKKKKEIEWKKEVGNNCKKWKQTESGRLCMELVGLSYKNLSQNLKRCFRYLSLFPKYYKISSKRLILLWVAIEFVIDDNDEKAEEKAECCLDELVEKGLIIEEKWGHGRLKLCSMHPLLHDICVSEAVETDYVEIHSENECIHRNSELTRRLGIHNCSKKTHKLPESTSKKLRSLTWVNNAEIFTLDIKRFKLLWVLDLQDAKIKKLPAEIWEMVLITYLGLRKTQLQALPSFRGVNHRLQTLDIRDTKIRVIPDGVWKIKTLRHIHGKNLKAPHIGRTTFNNLQTLHGVETGDWIQSSGLADGNTLNSLKLIGHQNSKPPRFTCFCNSDNLNMLPKNLTRVLLSKINLDENLWDMLGRLSELRVLKAKYGSVSDHDVLVCTESMFRKLQKLRLCNINSLKKLKVEKDAVPLLAYFAIENCTELEELSVKMKSFENIKKLELEGIPAEAAKKFNHNHAQKIKVVPWVIINGKISKDGTSPAVSYKMKNFITPKSPFYV